MNLLDAMRYLAALEQHRHFGRAAQACHITQPALSNALRALEAELGVAIVRRGRQYEGLTPEGERVLGSARRMLHEHERLRQDLASSATQASGVLHLGSVPSALPVAAQFAVWLQRDHPGVKVQLRSLSSPAIDAGLENLTLDLALGYIDRPAEGGRRRQTWPQYEEHYFAVLDAAQGLGSGGSTGPAAPLNWSGLAGRRLVLLAPEMHHRAIVDAALREGGVPAEAVQVAMETDSVLALVAAVQAGGLASVLPGALVRSLQPSAGLSVHPLIGPAVHTAVGWIGRPSEQTSRVVAAALALAGSQAWRAHLPRLSGALPGPLPFKD
jgi:DNA-binding transcriptional LysR family regulator